MIPTTTRIARAATVLSARTVCACALILAGAVFGGPAAAQELADIDPAIQTKARASKDAAVVIGNEAYAALPQATYATADAFSFKEWVYRTHGVSKYRLRYVENTSAQTIYSEIKRMRRKVRRGGTLWVYYAGHGAVTDEGERTLLGVDANVERPTDAGVTLEQLQGLLDGYRRVNRTIFIVDAGFGGLGRDGLEIAPGSNWEVAGPPAPAADNITLWLADQGNGPAEVYHRSKHGLFTWLTIGALRGWADGEETGERDGVVTLSEAQNYTWWTGRHLGRITNPAIEDRPEPATWTVARGSHLEEGPSKDQLSILSQEDRNRRYAELEATIRAEAAAFWQDTLAIAKEGGEGGPQALQAFIDEYSDTVIHLEWALALPEVREARKVLAQYETGDAQAALEAAVLEPCDDLVALEGPAMLGQLTLGQKNCLEGRITTDRMQTTKDKISRVLLANAEGAGDPEEWERLMARHLEEVDRSDPGLCFRYALYLHKGDVENAEEAIKWADYALANKAEWEGPEFVKRVNGLYRLRAEASSRLWLDAEKAYQESRTMDAEDEANEYRGWAANYSREWLDYSVAAELPSDTAYKLCVSAAGTTDFCRTAGGPN